MNNKLIYIAGRIGNLEESVYRPKFEKAVKEVESFGYMGVSPIDLTHDHDKEWLSYMRRDITALMKCDAVYACTDWRESKGATLEIMLALELGIPVLYQSNLYLFQHSSFSISDLNAGQIKELQLNYRKLESADHIPDEGYDRQIYSKEVCAEVLTVWTKQIKESIKTSPDESS